MKQNSKNIGLMAALVAISIGATYGLTSGFSDDIFGSPSSTSGAFLTGHIEAIVKDNAGNIIAYRQADNAIVTNGMDIIASQVFRVDTVPGGNLTNSTQGPVGWMNIGNNSGNTAVTSTDVELDCPLEFATQARCGILNGQEDTPRTSCVGVEAAMESSGGRDYFGSAQVNVTAIATFDGADCNSIAISEAAMWNNATNTGGDFGEMFARNTFGAVTLTTTDSLELTWRFTFTDN